MPFSCVVSDGATHILASEPRYYDIIGDRQRSTARTCDAAGGACRHVGLEAFLVACDGGTARWFDIATTAAALRGGGVRIRDGAMQLQWHGVQRDWPDADCPGADWPQRAFPLSTRPSPFPNTGCSGVGTFDVDAHADAFPKGFAPVAEIGARVVAVPAFNALGPAATRALPDAPARNPRSNPRLRDIARGLTATAAAVASPEEAASPQPAAQQPVRLAQNATSGGVGGGVVHQQASLHPWITLVEAHTPPIGPPGDAQRRFERWIVIGLFALACIAGLISGIGWLVSVRNRGPYRPADAYEVILRRDGVDLTRPDAQICGDLCRTAQNLVLEVHEQIGALNGVAPLRRTLLREIRDLEYFLSTLMATAPDDDSGWRKMRAKLQRIVNDMMRLKDIVESARRSLSTARIERGLPRDRDEAFEALGANPTTSARILKKLVDALRVTWHPDLAVDEADRMAREERIKQINAAWDLINGARVEA